MLLFRLPSETDTTDCVSKDIELWGQKKDLTSPACLTKYSKY